MKNIKEYVERILFDELDKDEIDKINIKIINSPLINSIAGIKPNIKASRYTIFINMNKINKSKKEDILDNVYTSVIHELEHFKTFEYTKKDNFYEYEHLISLLEYIYYITILNIKPKDNNNLSKKIILGDLLKRNYNISTGEIKSTLESRKKLSKRRNNPLDKEVVKGLEILNESMEITYFENKIVSKVRLYLGFSVKYLFQNPDLIKDYKILSILFNDDGTLKSILELFNSRNNLNSKIIDNIMLELIDKNNIPDNEEFEKYFNNLVINYNKKVVYYVDNIKYGEVLVDKKDLRHNLYYIKDKARKLNRIIDELNLNDEYLKVI